MALSELLIKINGDAQDAVAAFDDVKAQSADLQGVLGDITAKSAIAFAALTAEIGFAAHAFKEADDAAKQLSLSLQNQGIFSTGLVSKYKEQAEALEKLTGIDDDLITKGQAVFQSFGGQIEVTQELAQAALDLGTKVGGPVAGFELLGRSLTNATLLHRQFGITIDENLPRQQKLAAIIDAVNQKFGGQAVELRQGLGVFGALKTALGNIQEELGKRFAPALAEAGEKLLSVLESAKNNKPLLDLAAAIIAGGAAATGTVAFLGSLALAIITANAAAVALGFTLTAVAGPIAILVAGIGALVGGFVLLRNEANKPATEKLDREIKETTAGIERLKQVAATPGANVFTKDIEKDLAEANKKLEELKNKKDALNAAGPEAAKKATSEEVQDPKKLAAAREAAEERNRIDDLRVEKSRANNEALELELAKASQRAIELKKQEISILGQLETEKNEAQLQLLEQQFQEKQQLQEANRIEDAQRKIDFQADQDAVDAELRDAKLAQSDILRKEDLAKLQEQKQTELDISRKIVTDELTERQKSQAKKIEEQKKFGEVYATINAQVNSKEVNAAADASGQLAALANSKNETLKAIGKAAAITQIGIDTAKGAMAVYANFQTAIPYPPVSIPLGIAAAAAITAYGAERIANVTQAADGGIVEGIGSGDKMPFLLEPGELVVPKRNFAETVGAIQNDRANRDDEILAELQSLNSKAAGVTVNISGDFIGQESFVTGKLIPMIKDAVLFQNADLGV